MRIRFKQQLILIIIIICYCNELKADNDIKLNYSNIRGCLLAKIYSIYKDNNNIYAKISFDINLREDTTCICRGGGYYFYVRNEKNNKIITRGQTGVGTFTISKKEMPYIFSIKFPYKHGNNYTIITLCD